MFQSVRHWWTGGRGKVTLRLFLFEFVVIVAGVLVAQALAGWAGDRAAIRRMEEARSDARRAIAQTATLVNGIATAAPCIEQRMSKLMNLVARHEPVSAEMLRRPSFYPPSLRDFPEDDLVLLSKRHGQEERRALTGAIYLANGIRANLEESSSEWSAFAQLDPRNGPVSESDRAEARRAAGRIKELFEGIQTRSRSFLGATRSLGIVPASQIFDMRIIRSCDDLWRANALLPTTKAIS